MSTVNAIDASPPVATAPLGASRRSCVIGAVFLMASAIGPGFITQTAKFTLELGASFACAILLRSISNLPQTRRASCCGS